MRRAFWYTGAWAAATSVGVTASWFGCTVVLHESASAPPRALAAIRAESGQPDQLAVAQPRLATAPEQPRTAARTDTPHTSRSIRPVPYGNPATYLVHGVPPPHTQQTVRPLATTGPTSTADPTGEERAYQVLGGTATVRFSVDDVRVIRYEPSPGYRAFVDQSRPDELVVVFSRVVISRLHEESDLHATWDGGPRASQTQYWW